MNRSLRLSIHAERDLTNIFDYTLERWGELQFIRYRQLLAAALDQLTTDPGRQIPAPGKICSPVVVR